MKDKQKMKKILLGLMIVLCAACSEENTLPEKAASEITVSAPKPTPTKPAALGEEAQGLANLLAQFEQENNQRAEKLQDQFEEDTTGEQAAKLVRDEIKFVQAHIQRLKDFPLAQAPVIAIRDKLIRAYEADVQIAEQTAAFFVAAEASSPEAQAVLASEPAAPEIDSSVAEEEALQALGELLKAEMASAPESASAVVASSASVVAAAK
ncbi:hypothetical protein [Wielerella bovis]|uniref:hypothetical protein n=1 Tax=Wielerella bovis TaxID=2917790 RepID=UPI002019E17C|nr:hypothetical protein [Wielerella bovis]ULJ60735.1 hypothetical protein MIS44_02375 [Wielerella bovis]